MKVLSWDVGTLNLSYCILERYENGNVKILKWDIINLIENNEMKKNTNLLFENIPKKLKECPELLDVDVVIIENQPSLQNPKMKSIQMILYSYFLIMGKVEKGTVQKIDFCSASNKLKVYDGPPILLKKSETKKKEIIQGESVQGESVQGESVQSESVQGESVQGESVQSESVQGESVQGESVRGKKPPKKEKLTYTDKKKMAIQQAHYFVQKDNISWIDFFNSHKKKDDLSDSFLQGLYWIKNAKGL